MEQPPVKMSVPYHRDGLSMADVYDSVKRPDEADAKLLEVIKEKDLLIQNYEKAVDILTAERDAAMDTIAELKKQIAELKGGK